MVSKIPRYVFFLLLTACAHTMDARNSETESQLISALGAPHSVAVTPDGKRVLTWKRPWTGFFWVRHECRQTYTIGRDGKVEQATEEDCYG